MNFHLETRPHRPIQLDEDVELSPTDFYSHTVTEKNGKTVVTERCREGDELVIREESVELTKLAFGVMSSKTVTESRIPALIPLEWIAKQVTLDPDNDAELPWNDQDGWEHDLRQWDSDKCKLEDFRQSLGYVDAGCIPRYGHCRVVVTDASFCNDSEEDRYKALRAKGASKQVARERIASDNRDYIHQIKEWYECGYECVIVNVEVRLGDKVYEDSLGGVDDEDYARGECALEMASQVASQLEKDGFTVVGNSPEDRNRRYLENRTYHKKWRLCYNLNMFNWTAQN